MLDLYDKPLHIGDKVAVKPNNGYYGKWKIGVIVEMKDVSVVRIRYDEACLYHANTESGFEHRHSFGNKWCRHVILLDKETLLPIGKV